MDDLRHIRGIVIGLLAQKPLVLLAIDGYGGSGKTTLARAIQSEFQDSAIITLDDFAIPGGGSDRRRILSQVLVPLTQGEDANFQRFDWPTQSLAEWREVEPAGLIVIEGVSALGEDFNAYYDFRIWIDCPHELASRRGMERDKNVYLVDHDRMWEEIWIPEEQEYAKTEPWIRADLITKAQGL